MGNDFTMDNRERDYPFAVLNPVVLMLTFPQEEFEVDLDTPTESKSGSDVVEKQYVSYQDVRLPRWEGSYNNIIQKNTCVLYLIVKDSALLDMQCLVFCQIF